MRKIQSLFTVTTQVIAGILVAIVTLSLLLWFNYPVVKLTGAWVSKGYSPTPPPPTETLRPTRTLRNTPTPTVIPSPTFTPLPPSAYQVSDLTSVDPPIPASGISAVILGVDEANANPPFTDIQWTSSSKIAKDIGREITEKYYATWGPATVTWKMDVPLTPALYEIFILDTLYSSAGSLDFTVSLGKSELKPILGSSHMVYKSAQGNPPQNNDLWHPVGIYSIDQKDLLSISTSWDRREQENVVAIDRVLILQLPSSVRTLLDKLPHDHQLFVVDDSSATFDTYQYWETRTNGLAWEDQYQVMTDPPIQTKVTWNVTDDVPVDRYEVKVWIPDINGTAEVTYKLYANGDLIKREDSSDSIKLAQGSHTGGQWLSIGTWKIPDIYGISISLSLKLETTNESQGEVAVDAVAFIRAP